MMSASAVLSVVWKFVVLWIDASFLSLTAGKKLENLLDYHSRSRRRVVVNLAFMSQIMKHGVSL